MDLGQLKKFSTTKAIDVYKHFRVEDAAQGLLNPEFSTTDFLGNAIKNEYYLDAIRFIAHGLPRREAIIWCYQGILAINNAISTKEEQQILVLTKQWLDKPEENLRFMLVKLAEKLEYKTAISWLAMAVFWSGGSIIEPGKPVVEPDPYLTAKAVVGALHLATVLPEPSKLEQKFLVIIKQGIAIANEEN